MRVFITGVAGFLGSHLAERLLSLGHEVIGNDNLIGGDLDNVPKDVYFYEADCRNLDDMEDAMQGCDIVYHLACTAYEGLSVFSPCLVADNTVQASVSAMTAAIRNGAKRFVFASSMARYGAQQAPFHEGMGKKPVDPYGISKAAAEDILKVLAETHGIELVIAVPHNIYGPKQKYDDPFRNVAAIMMNRCLQGKAPIIYGDGEQKRCFSYISDVLDCLVRLGFDCGLDKETINIGPDEGTVTVNELSKIIMRITGFEGEPIHVGGRPREVKHAMCLSEKARELLGYQTKVDLETGLKEMHLWMKEKGAKDFVYHLPIEILNDKVPKTWKERLF